MSGYFVHAGTQYPFGQSQTQNVQQSTSTVATNNTAAANTVSYAQSFYSNYANAAYPTAQSQATANTTQSQYSYGQNAYSYGQNTGYNTSQYNASSYGNAASTAPVANTYAAGTQNTGTYGSTMTNTGYGNYGTTGYAATATGYGTAQNTATQQNTMTQQNTRGQNMMGQQNTMTQQNTRGLNTVGQSTMGHGNMGQSNVGHSTMGQSSMGQSSMGQSSMVQNTMGQTNMGYGNMGHRTMGQATPAQSTVGQSNMGRNVGHGTMGQSNISHGNIGQSNMGQGHGTIGQSTMGQGNLSQNTMGHGTMGQSNMGQSNLGQSNMGQGTMGQNTMGQNTMGHSNMGPSNVGHVNTKGPNTTGQGVTGQGAMGQKSRGPPNTRGQNTMGPKNVAQSSNLTGTGQTGGNQNTSNYSSNTSNTGNTGSNNSKSSNYGYGFQKQSDSSSNHYEKQLASAANQFNNSRRGRGGGNRGSNYNSGGSGYNSGYNNSGGGGYNSGYNNSGGYNSGGNYNSGGGYHSGGNYSGGGSGGGYNSGYNNSGGGYNSGGYNSGNYNSGPYNSGSYSGGFGGSGGGGRWRGRPSRGGGGGGGGGGYGPQSHPHPPSSPQNTGPKSIKALEIKAFLYAWCGQRKLKPEYEISPQGQIHVPRTMFTCTLIITGLDYVAEARAASKKDAQSKAAWNFCEHLVKTGYMKASELPPRPYESGPKDSSGVSTEAIGSLPPETPEDVERHGGWNLANCRQRLNQFCQREHYGPDFRHEIHGPEHSRIFVCELSLYVSAVRKEFYANERGSNKKQATAVCSLSMVRQLYKQGLIEKFGEPFKHVTRGALLNAKLIEMDELDMMIDGNANAGLKRKAEAEPENVDENGNWTTEHSRQRLNQFCQVNNMPCDVIYSEEGQTGSKSYTASLTLKVKTEGSVEEQDVAAEAVGQSKKAAAQGCALKIISQLYKLKLVEANAWAEALPNKKKPQKRGKILQDQFNYLPVMGGMQNYMQDSDSFGGHGPWAPPVHRTALNDAHINEKHKQIYPSEQQLEIVQRSVKMVELALKKVSEELDSASEVVETAEDTPPEGSKKRKLQGVMRVGYLAKGLLLSHDNVVDLVLLCLEQPTAKLLTHVAQSLPKHIVNVAKEKSNIETSMQDSQIIIQICSDADESDVKLTINIHLTSPAVRTATKTEDAAQDAPGTLNKEKCLKSLAELRHSKWFQACANIIPSCVIVIRILREIKLRCPEWNAISDWALELLVEKSLRTSPVPMSLGGSLQRVMEVIGSGILLAGSGGVQDPCEREEVDVMDHLSEQDREDLTVSAQNFLRMLVFRQAHQVLGMEALPKPEWLVKKTEAISMN